MTNSIQIWDDIHRDNIWGTCPETLVARWAMRNWGGAVKNALGDVRILEVGCGLGAQSVWLGQHGFLVEGIDASPHAIRRADQMNPLPHSVRLSVGVLPDTVEDMPSDYYDGVVDVCTLQHVDEIERSIRALHRIIRLGGQMISVLATLNHADLEREELKGTVFRRLKHHEARQLFEPVFSRVRVDTMSRTDGDAMICHWIVQATR